MVINAEKSYPALNGFSGPMNAVEHPTSLAKAITLSGLLISSTLKVEHKEIIPGLLFEPKVRKALTPFPNHIFHRKFDKTWRWSCFLGDVIRNNFIIHI